MSSLGVSKNRDSEIAASKPRKPRTGNPPGSGRFVLSRASYERMMRALGKEPKPDAR